MTIHGDMVASKYRATKIPELPLREQLSWRSTSMKSTLQNKKQNILVLSN